MAPTAFTAVGAYTCYKLMTAFPGNNITLRVIAGGEEISEIVKSLNEHEKVSFLLAEQSTDAALRFAHYGYVLESGRIVMDGPAAALRENPDIKEFYLGIGDEGRRSFRGVRWYRRRKRGTSTSGIGLPRRGRSP